MLDMRLRLRELLQKQGITTAYGLHKAALGNISMTTAVRLMKAAEANKKPVALELDTIAILCDLFGVTPDKLLEHKPRPLKPKEAA